MSDASDKIDSYIAALPQWQADNLIRFRQLVHNADPSLEEQWKWSTPIFAIDGKMMFAMSAFKAHTKYNFIKNGAKLQDPNRLFNNGLESKSSRSIDLREGETVDEKQLQSLVAEALQVGVVS